jgi:hypothetical protein
MHMGGSGQMTQMLPLARWSLSVLVLHCVFDISDQSCYMCISTVFQLANSGRSVADKSNAYVTQQYNR